MRSGVLRRQRGSALLIALITAALAAVIATALLERGQRSLARSEALLASERSWQYAQGMSILARRMLEEAMAQGAEAAALDGSWTAPFQVPGGMVQGRLIDQGALFNLNALGHPDGATATEAREAFRRLLEQIGLNPIIAEELADWLDGAVMPRPGSAANDWYARQDPPYRTAGVLLANASELRWLRSVDAAAWQALAPLVTALPEPELRINVNTARPEVLAAVVAELDVEQARRVIADGPYSQPVHFIEHPLVAPLIRPDERVRLGIRSRWYLAQARVVIDGVERDYFRLMNGSAAGYDGFRRFSQGVP
ncbi:type II secretion system minor pseudopilin GspK [Wenzhouxiangella sediminis]|uniref:type II secretion system minor pseudopilin GspK n=1 Tax=Wenzhouxiangella sediminis TaxID=1792836 RepID=UPI0015F28AFF|nr:type II secretion system minor pseudopilin GspK [Wenzhouxiangella sediminis]